MKRATITDYDLTQFCRFYSKQFGAVQDLSLIAEIDKMITIV